MYRQSQNHIIEWDNLERHLKWQKPLEFQRFFFALGQFWAKLLIDEIALLRISWYNNFEHEMAVTMPDSVYYF